MKKITRTVCGIGLLILGIGCQVSTADEWKEGGLTLSVDNYFSHALTENSGSPLLAVSCRDSKLREAMVQAENFTFQTPGSGYDGANLYVVYEQGGSTWTVNSGRDTPQYYVDPDFETSALNLTTHYHAYGHYYPEQYGGASYLIDGTIGFYGTQADVQAITLVKDQLFSLAAGFITTSQWGDFGDNNLTLRKVSYSSATPPDAVYEMPILGELPESGKADQISDIELESLSDQLHAAWILDGKINYMSGAADTGLDANSRQVIGDASEIHLAVGDLGVYILAIDQNKAFLYKIETVAEDTTIISKLGDASTGDLTLSNSGPIVAIRNPQKGLEVYSGLNLIVKERLYVECTEISICVSKNQLWVSAFTPASEASEANLYPGGTIETWSALLQ